MGIHWQELVVILLIVLVLFGPKRLPEVGSSLGRGIRGFKDSLNGLDGGSTSAHVTATNVTENASTTSPAVPVPVEIVEPSTTSPDRTAR